MRSQQVPEGVELVDHADRAEGRVGGEQVVAHVQGGIQLAVRSLGG
ncbi:hypothetical protein ACFWXK_31385 [Streptomyces sp. NPDC059070]